jgi:hypothetical protein
MADRVGLILVAAIQKAGGDGLYNTDGECACVLGDLAPCDGMTLDCTIGRRLTCGKCGGWAVVDFDAKRPIHCYSCGAELREAQNG